MAVSGTTVVAAAPNRTVGSNARQGAAYVFSDSATGWVQTGELIASDGAAQDFLGASVALSGSTVVAGAPYHKVGSNSAQGVAYVFGGARQSTTTVYCSAATQPTLRCTASVVDSSGQSPTQVPTGTVSFTASAGSFAPSSCTLVVGQLFASCSVTYTPPAASSSTGITVTAGYGGDGNFNPSRATLTLCPSGQPLELDSVSASGPDSDGFEVGSQVVLHGCGFQAGMQLTWGAADQTPEQISNPASIGGNGTTATVSVPWGAVTGTITLQNGTNQATLAGQAVDSWRNTLGLNFENYGGYTTRRQFANAFVTPTTTGQTSANGQPILLPRYETFYSARSSPGGFCFGFAYFAGVRATLGTPAVAGIDPFHLDTKSADQSEVQSDWWKQFSDESRALLNGENYQSATQLRSALSSESWNSPTIVDLYWTETRTYGNGRMVVTHAAHAILSFAVEDTSASNPPGDFTIATYNSNDPFTSGEDGSGPAHANALSASNIAFDPAGVGSFPEFALSDIAPTNVKTEPISQLSGPLHLLQAVGLTNVLGPTTSVVSANGPSGAPINLASGGSGGFTIVPLSDSTTAPASSTNPGSGESRRSSGRKAAGGRRSPTSTGGSRRRGSRPRSRRASMAPPGRTSSTSTPGTKPWRWLRPPRPRPRAAARSR